MRCGRLYSITDFRGCLELKSGTPLGSGWRMTRWGKCVTSDLNALPGEFMRSRKSIKEQSPAKSVNKSKSSFSFSTDPILPNTTDVVSARSLPREQQVDFANLGDGTLIEMIEDPNDSANSLLAIYRNGKVRYTGKLERDDRVLVPVPRQDGILRHIRLARGSQPYESLRSLMSDVGGLIRACVDMDSTDTILVAAFVVSTWFIERLPVAPYLALVGQPRSGKTTMLQVLNLLCRLPLFTSDITSAAYYEVYDVLTPTLLVDETLTAGNKRALFHLLKTGTTRGSVTLRRGRSLKAFGPKVVSWTELPNDPALNSRCVIIPMQETRRTDLSKPSDKHILYHADVIRMRLLQFRFENFKSLLLPAIPGDERLHSRTRDLYQALALPLGSDAELCKDLVRVFEDQQEINREPLSPAAGAILWVLYLWDHSYSPGGKCAIRDLTNAVNSHLERVGEALRLNAHEVGRALTSLGITNRKRTNSGFFVYLDQKTKLRIHNLAYGHGIDQENPFQGNGFGDHCELCRNLRAPSPPTETKGNSGMPSN